MTYQIYDVYSANLIFTAFSFAVFILSMLVGCFVLFILKQTTKVKINKAAPKFRDAAIVMSIETSKAQAANDAYLSKNGLPPERNQYAEVTRDEV